MVRQRKKYQQAYYQKNKERIREYKKAKYGGDGEYKLKAVKRSKVQQNIKSFSRPVRRGTCIHNGVEESIYSFSNMVLISGRARDTIYKWRTDGVIPDTKHRNNRGEVLYAYSQIRLFQYLLRDIDEKRVNCSYTELKEMMEKYWGKTFDEKEVQWENQ